MAKLFNKDDYSTKDYDNPKELSIQFTKKAYELLDIVKKNPYDFDGVRRYISHGYYLEASACKKPSAKKQFNILLCKQDVDSLRHNKANTYHDDNLVIGIAKLQMKYLSYLLEDKII